eukprot:SAG22_NODE_447_length_10412_cov_7.930088_4_plen_127_part_00
MQRHSLLGALVGVDTFSICASCFLYWWHAADEQQSPADYLKEDSCGGSMHGSTWQQYARMRDALNSTGRRIFFSICEGVPFDDGPARQQMHCPYLPFTVKVRAHPAMQYLLQSLICITVRNLLFGR